jgi:hypothetical protein
MPLTPLTKERIDELVERSKAYHNDVPPMAPVEFRELCRLALANLETQEWLEILAETERKQCAIGTFADHGRCAPVEVTLRKLRGQS